MDRRHISTRSNTVKRRHREELLQQRGSVIWFTGLSGAGKSTLANALEEWLIGHGKLTYLLDGDIVRHGLNRDLGFSHEDRTENIRRIAETAKLFADCGVICISAFISPFRNSRDMARSIITDHDLFIVYVSTPLEVCEQRDPKGLYQKARQGEISNFTGIDSPYETPLAPHLTLNTADHDVNACVRQVVDLLVKSEVIPPLSAKL